MCWSGDDIRGYYGVPEPRQSSVTGWKGVGRKILHLLATGFQCTNMMTQDEAADHVGAHNDEPWLT